MEVAMKKITVKDLADLENGFKFEDFFLVKKCEKRSTSAGKDYLDLTFVDATGSVVGRKWEIEDRDNLLKPGKDGTPRLICGQFEITKWNSSKQLKLWSWRPAQKEDGMKLEDFIEPAPEPSPAMFDFIRSRAESIADGDLKKICLYYLDGNEAKLMYYPAAMSNHHAVYGGLLYHMKRMILVGDRLCQVYELLDPDWLIAGIILHDMQKINEIEANQYGMATDYSFEGKLLGHLVMGVREVEKAAEELKIDREKASLLEHMVLAHHEQPEFGSPVYPAFPEAEILHHIDNIDAKIYDMEKAMEKTKKGEFSERIRTLDGRQMYKRGKDD